MPPFAIQSQRNVILRSIQLEVFCKKGALGNFVKFIEKHLCQSLFFNKVAGLSPATLFKKRLWHRCIPVNFVKSLRTPFFHKTTPVAASELSDVDLSSKRTLSSVLRFLKGKRFTDNFYILLLAVIGFFSRVG